MRFITGMLTASLVCGCGVSDDVAHPGAPGPAAGDTASVSAALRVGRRPPRVGAKVRAALSSAATRLSDLQADAIGDNARNGLDDTDPDDGGWDFTLASTASAHSASASAENTYGATALGVWGAVRAGADTQRYRTTLLGTGLGTQQRAAVDSPNDFVFLPLLGELADDPGFSELARARYDAKLATYSGAQSLAQKDRDARVSSNARGLILYDLAWYSLGAASLDAAFPGSGYDADADTFATVAVAALTASPPLFDTNDATQSFYVQGLAWSLVVLERTGSSPALDSQIRSKLHDLQASDGSWGYNAGTPQDDIQSTAHAVAALALTSASDRQGRAEASRGARFLASKQASNGGWEYAAGSESPLVDGEAMLAIYLSHTSGDVLEPGPTSDIGQATSALTTAEAAGATQLSAPAD